ncbi:MAG: hypothetical protein ACK51N_03000 [bacterium]|nr:hypothetical protein [Phycisphaerales bacterium]MCE2652097.1 hypothetical protein [Planctomycetaceae bacterium]
MSTPTDHTSLGPVDPGHNAHAEGGGHDMALTADMSASLIGVQAGTARRRFTSGNVTIALLLVLAGGALVFMRHMGLGAGMASAMDGEKLAEVEAPKIRGDYAAVLADLTTSRTTHQVPVDKLKKNPFRLINSAITPAVTGADGSADASAARRQLEEAAKKRMAEQADWEKKVAAAESQLRLNSIIGGSYPLARVSGQNVRVGDRIGEYFTVTEIGARHVTLQVDGGRQTTLSLDPAGRN